MNDIWERFHISLKIKEIAFIITCMLIDTIFF